MVKIIRLFIAACALAGCVSYEASFDDCAIHCSADTGCPGDLTCGAEGLCRSAEAPVCVLPSDGTGGTITHVGGRTIHTFLASQSVATFTPPPALGTAEVLVVAGGGGGGMTRGAGGGGGGGVIYVANYILEQPSYAVMIGYGGISMTDGGNSTFGTITANGGGAGRACAAPDGGSGGGASHDAANGSAGTGTPGQGNAGGVSGYNSGSMTFTGAGGGGAGGRGQNGSSGSGGAGGPGIAYSISGEEMFYGGGGGGGDQDFGSHGLTPGLGSGGGGDGGLNSPGKPGVDGTGGGGGGGGGGDLNDNFYSGGQGGTGIVIISYPTT